MGRRVYVVGTADTKGDELAFLADAIAATGIEVLRVDIGTRRPTVHVDIEASEVAAHHPEGPAAVLGGDDRGVAVAAMTEAFARFIDSRSDIAGIIGIGGGGGTAIVTAGMRRLPLGLPKIMVSTLASGDVAPYVDISDIVMMPSITDMTGLNRLSRVILSNAAQAIAAMAKAPAVAIEGKPALGLTMFGVTTACVTAIADAMREDYDCLVFHATGTGGRTMEKLADSGLLAGVIDITTTEVCDLLFGGVLPATEDRLGAIARTGLPYVGSLGALDMINFWAPPTVPEKYRGRLLLQAQPQRHADADLACRMRCDRPLDRREAQSLRRTRALADPGKRRVGAGRRGRRLLRSRCRRRAVCGNRGNAGPDRAAPAGQAAAPHQRPAFRQGRGRRLP